MLNLRLLSVVTLCFAGSDNGYAVLAQRTSHTTVTNVQSDLLQFFGHPRPAEAAKTETRPLFDVRQRHQIRSLFATERALAKYSKTAWIDCHNTTHPIDGKFRSVFFDESKPDGFWLAKTLVALSPKINPQDRLPNGANLARSFPP